MTSQQERALLQEAEQFIRTYLPFQAVPSKRFAGMDKSKICTQPIDFGVIVHDCVYKDGVLEWSFIYSTGIVHWKRSSSDAEWKRFLGIRNYNEMVYMSDGGPMNFADAMTVSSSRLFRSVLDLAANEMPHKYTGPMPPYEEGLSKRARPTRYVGFHEHSDSDDEDGGKKKKKSKGHAPAPEDEVEIVAASAPVRSAKWSKFGQSLEAGADSSKDAPLEIDSDDYTYVAGKVTDFVKQLQQSRTTDGSELDLKREALSRLQEELRSIHADNAAERHQQAINLWQANQASHAEHSWQIHDAFGTFSSMFVGGGIRGALKLNNQLYLTEIMNFFLRAYPAHLLDQKNSAPALPHIDLLHQTHSKFETFEVSPAWNYIQSIQYTPLGKQQRSTAISTGLGNEGGVVDGSEWRCGVGEHYLFRYNENHRLSELSEYKGRLGRGYYYSFEVPTTEGFNGVINLVNSDVGYHTVYIDRVYTGNIGHIGHTDDIQQAIDCDSYRNRNLIAVAQKRSCCPFLKIVYRFAAEVPVFQTTPNA